MYLCCRVPIDKPESKSQVQAQREREIWTQGCLYNLIVLGGQQEGEHGWDQHDQGEHHQRNVLRVFMIERGLAGNPESS